MSSHIQRLGWRAFPCEHFCTDLQIIFGFVWRGSHILQCEQHQSLHFPKSISPLGPEEDSARETCEPLQDRSSRASLVGQFIAQAGSWLHSPTTPPLATA